MRDTPDSSPASDDRPLSGGILVDKPPGWTSHDVVGRMRRLAGTRRVGHTGTLDPFATGLLVICVGPATRLSQLLTGCEKEYLAVMRLGWATDTQDLTGEPLGPAADAARIPDDPDVIRRALGAFEGEIDQVPPMYSAKKIDGTALYKLARRGEEVERKAVRVRVRMEMLGSGLGVELAAGAPLPEPVSRDGALARAQDRAVDVLVRVTCSVGTYVRTLAHDTGALLGCGGHLRELRRTRVGRFGIDDAATLEALEGHVAERLIAPTDLAADLPALFVDADEVDRVFHGNSVSLANRIDPWADGDCRIVGPAGELLAVARVDRDAGLARPRIVFNG